MPDLLRARDVERNSLDGQAISLEARSEREVAYRRRRQIPRDQSDDNKDQKRTKLDDTKITTDANPVLDYSTMGVPKSHTSDENAFAQMQREKLSAENIQKLIAQNVPDPHRPPCTNRVLQKIEAFMKKNYCGESPFGEGSDDTCDLRNRKKRNGNIKVIADFDCEWNETKNESECKQQGQVSPGLRTILVHQLEELGMPAKAPGEIYFKVWQPNRADWLVAQSINRTAPELTLTCARWSRSLTRIVE